MVQNQKHVDQTNKKNRPIKKYYGIRVNWKTFLIQTLSGFIYKPIIQITEHVLCQKTNILHGILFFP